MLEVELDSEAILYSHVVPLLFNTFCKHIDNAIYKINTD